MIHKTEGLARHCSAWDLFTITGGLQCGNCLAASVQEPKTSRCVDRPSDGPCPLLAEHDSGRCWVHEVQAKDSAQ